VSDRDFVVEFLSCVAMLMMHLSRLGEELILWSSEAFGFLSLRMLSAPGAASCRRRKIRDVLELIRPRPVGSMVISLAC